MRIAQRALLLPAFSVAARRQAVVAAAARQDGCTAPQTAMCALNVFANLPQFFCLSFVNFGDILSGHCGGPLVSEMLVIFKVLYLTIWFPRQEHSAHSFCCKSRDFWPVIDFG